jgi:hypothetical protein
MFWKKAGLAPAFLCAFSVCVLAALLPAAAIALEKRDAIQQTVDGLQRALEIIARSSYVPSAPNGVRSRFPEDARPNTARLTRLEMPIWMK